MIAAGAVLALAIGFMDTAESPVTRSMQDAPQVAPVADYRDSVESIAALPREQFEQIDIARLNLIAAQGLPGSEDLDVEATLRTLDRWAEHVRAETDRHMYLFTVSPHEYQHSEAYFRVLMLIRVLQEDCGVRYNPQRIDEPDFTNSKDLFIHGMIGDDNGGTCVSMPVLYVAVGRRLGYPLHLVVTKGHVFARWDDPKTGERFNIEGTSRGLNTNTDEFYAHWPYELSDAEKRNGWFLRSLAPEEELALFLINRGYCLEDTGRTQEARRHTASHRDSPRSRRRQHFSRRLIDAIAQSSIDSMRSQKSAVSETPGSATSNAFWTSNNSGCPTLGRAHPLLADDRILHAHPSQATPRFPASPAEACDGTISATRLDAGERTRRKANCDHPHQTPHRSLRTRCPHGLRAGCVRTLRPGCGALAGARPCRDSSRNQRSKPSHGRTVCRWNEHV